MVDGFGLTPDPEAGTPTTGSCSPAEEGTTTDTGVSPARIPADRVSVSVLPEAENSALNSAASAPSSASVSGSAAPDGAWLEVYPVSWVQGSK